MRRGPLKLHPELLSSARLLDDARHWRLSGNIEQALEAERKAEHSLRRRFNSQLVDSLLSAWEGSLEQCPSALVEWQQVDSE